MTKKVPAALLLLAAVLALVPLSLDAAGPKRGRKNPPAAAKANDSRWLRFAAREVSRREEACAAGGGAQRGVAEQLKPTWAEPLAGASAGPEQARATGMRAFIDPKTGELREPTPEEAKELSEAARKSAAPASADFEPVRHPDGMVSVDLKGAFMSHVVIFRNADGSFSTRCIAASHAGSDSSKPIPPRPLEEK